MAKLDESFYQRRDVTKVAKELIGKKLLTKIGRHVTGGIIVETEAYSHRERGCHAYNGRKTLRNEVMFEAGGLSYVYLCYGIHHLFNVVTNEPGVADAILVRALEPVTGEKHMLSRMNTTSLKRITSGPGKLTKALGIDRTFNGKYLAGTSIWIEEGIKVKPAQIITSVRIGIDYAGEDAFLPWRFYLKDSEWVSRY